MNRTRPQSKPIHKENPDANALRALEAAGLGLWEWHPYTDLEIWNDTLKELLADWFSKDAIPTQFRIFSIIDDKDVDRVTVTLKEAVSQCASFDVKFNLAGRDCPQVLLRMRGSVVSKDPLRVMAICDAVEETEQRLSKRLIDSLHLDLSGNHSPLDKVKNQFEWDKSVAAQQRILKLLFETTPAIILLLNQDGTIEYINPFMENLCGYQLKEVRGKDWFATFIPQRDFSEINQLFQQTAESNPTQQHRNLIITRDGQERLIEWSDETIHVGSGLEKVLLCVGLDVTDRIDAETKLRQSEEQLRLAMACANQGLWDLNLATGRATVSPEYATMLGFDPDHFRESYEQWSERLHPEDKASITEIFQEYLAGKRDEYQVEHRQRTKSGDWKWILSKGKITKWDKDGIPIRMLGTHTDISSIKETERQLRQHEAQLKLLIRNTPAGIVMLDRELRIIACSQRWLKDFGLDGQDVIGKPYATIINSESEDWNQILEHSLANSVGAKGEAPIRIMENSEEYLSWEVQPWQTDDLTVGGLCIFTSLITEQRKNEQQILAAHHQLRSVIDALFGFVGLYDLDGTLIEANKAPLVAAGLKREEVIGKPFWETYWWSYSTDVQNQLRNALGRAAGGELVRYEVPVRIKEGGMITIDVMFGPLCDMDDRITHIIGFGVDITERKKIEDELRMSVQRLAESQEVAHLGHWEWNILTDTITWSDEVFRIFGHAPQAFTPTYEDDFLNAVHPDDREMVADCVKETLRCNTPYSIEHRINRPTGEVRFLHEIGQVEIDSSQQPIRMIGTAQDITELKEAEQRLNLLHQELAHVGRISLMGEMAAGMAHELNQPLNAMLLYAEGCLEFVEENSFDKGKLRFGLAEIASSVKRAAKIIKNHRRFSTNHPLCFSALDVLDVVSSVRVFVNSKLIEHQVDYHLDLPEESLIINGDLLQLQQVLLNLIQNAIESQVSVPVQERRIDIVVNECPHYHVCIAVKDRGVGISEEHASQLFKPFFTTRETGLGMGLRISQTIIELHGGSIDFFPNSPAGAVFKITLPLKEICLQ